MCLQYVEHPVPLLRTTLCISGLQTSPAVAKDLMPWPLPIIGSPHALPRVFGDIMFIEKGHFSSKELQKCTVLSGIKSASNVTMSKTGYAGTRNMRRACCRNFSQWHTRQPAIGKRHPLCPNVCPLINAHEVLALSRGM